MRTYVFIVEGYKEAQSEFTQSAPSDEVTSIIDAYKALVNKNQVQGNERNIDYWRKQGWDSFKQFVSKKQELPTKTQIKRKKIVGNSKTIYEDPKWLVVIPLDKDASCFHGHDTDWCTTKQDQGYFEDYFYKNDVTLIYCLQKETGNKWAIASHEKVNEIELFDKQDNKITDQQFISQTGFNPKLLIQKATVHNPTIQSSRETYKTAFKKAEGIIFSQSYDYSYRHEELEQLLKYLKSPKLNSYYVQSVADEMGKTEFPKDITIPLLNEKPSFIRFIKNPSEQEQLVCVKNDPLNIKYIDHPSEKACRIVLENDGFALSYIPKTTPNYQQLCLVAVSHNGHAIRIVPKEYQNEELYITAVKQNGRALKHISTSKFTLKLLEAALSNTGTALEIVPEEMRTYPLCKIAVTNNEAALNDVPFKNLTPHEVRELCLIAVSKDGDSLGLVPDELRDFEICKLAVTTSPYSIFFVPETLPEYKQLKQLSDALIKKRGLLFN